MIFRFSMNTKFPYIQHCVTKIERPSIITNSSKRLSLILFLFLLIWIWPSTQWFQEPAHCSLVFLCLNYHDLSTSQLTSNPCILGWYEDFMQNQTNARWLLHPSIPWPAPIAAPLACSLSCSSRPWIATGLFRRSIIHSHCAHFLALFANTQWNKKSFCIISKLVISRLSHFAYHFTSVINLAIPAHTPKWCAKRDRQRTLTQNKSGKSTIIQRQKRQHEKTKVPSKKENIWEEQKEDVRENETWGKTEIRTDKERKYPATMSS